ncbi:hypothetical protein LMH87_005785 [Akanthomyces muscarius]|uniref:Uncharacterized protein n=1 Tax=Akanthomyces muscarius TaxID=2231603 RepID=A0A9W8QM26_AKAMU|nr:hypothetical protein LMH87_005785 [Akanthomyces muscarius]KAJ4164099.1 hypothetical protein LMH87_005785 [Akanthomyces muscarius]
MAVPFRENNRNWPAKAISSSRLGGVLKLWKCLAADVPQKPMLVYGRGWQQIYSPDTASKLLADRTRLSEPAWE